MPSTTETGRFAEGAAAHFLTQRDHRIVARNWRTRWCEIDLVSIRAGIVYFVEVKYRRRDDWGGGLDYITPRKLKQMRFAAEFWMAKSQGAAQAYRLAAIEVSGQHFAVTAWLDDVSA
jgi:uncharacterized protein (TIGR00252 family)